MFVHKWFARCLAGLSVAALVACGSAGSHTASSSGSNKPAASASAKASKPESTLLACAAHPLPAQLPSLTSRASAGQAMCTMLAIAGKDAQGVDADDRVPPVVISKDTSLCGGKPVVAEACTPHPATATVQVYFSPDMAWAKYGAGGSAQVQNAVISAYVTYLLYRHLQQSDKLDRLNQSGCYLAKVLEGLRQQGAIGKELSATYPQVTPEEACAVQG